MFQCLPLLVAFLAWKDPPSSKEIGSVLDDSAPKIWLRDGDLRLFIQEGLSSLNQIQSQSQYIEKLPTAWTLEMCNRRWRGFQAYAMDLDLGSGLKAARF